VETADANRNSRGTQGSRKIHGMWKLVRLDSDQGDHAASAAKLTGDALGPMRVLVSSKALTTISTSSPRMWRSRQSSAKPFRTASEFEESRNGTTG
jgi:hypothetical protein